MADRIESSENKNTTKETMMDELSRDSSKAFLDDIKPAMTQTKLEAEASWWKSLGKDNQAPAKLGTEQDLKKLSADGWQVEENKGYAYISRLSADGKLKESDTYERGSGQRLNQSFLKYDSKEAQAANKFSQVVDAYFADDGKSPLGVRIASGGYTSEFSARFNKDGTLASAEERGQDKDSTYYSFRKDGSLYEALTRSKTDSSVINDQLFNSKGQPRSDYNPLYLYEKVRRPIDNLYRGLREIRRSGGIF